MTHSELFESAPVALLVTDTDGRILEANALTRSWLEAGEGSLLQLLMAVVFVDELDFRQLHLMLMHDHGVISVERRIHDRGGRRYWVTIDVRAMDDGRRWLWALRDISDYHREEERLRLDNRRYYGMLEATSEGYVLIDVGGLTIREVNSALCRMLGLTADELMGRPLTAFTHPDSLERHQEMLRGIESSPQRHYEISLVAADGRTIDVDIKGATLFDDYGLAVSAFALITDITERKRNEERILYLALYDSLTALPNRVLLEERLKQALAWCLRERKVLALLFIDLDNFKQINDTLGHDVGDGLLRQLAKRLYHAVRKSDTVARLGGDEFIVLAPDLANREAAGQVAQKLLQALAEPFHVGDHVLPVTCSIGIAMAPEHGDTGVRLKQEADKAMYVAKARGRNQAAFCDEGD